MFNILASAAAILAAGAVAAPVGHGVETVRVSDLNLNRTSDVQRLDRRLEKAAMAACGAYDGSVRTMKQSVVRSDCYRETLAQARGQVPTLTAAR